MEIFIVKVGDEMWVRLTETEAQAWLNEQLKMQNPNNPEQGGVYRANTDLTDDNDGFACIVGDLRFFA